MDAYDLGIKQRPCPAAAVNTTDWFFAIAYQSNSGITTEPTPTSDFFNNYYEVAGINYQMALTRLTSAPMLFGEYGYTITKSAFSGGCAVGNLLNTYNGTIQMSSWVSFASTLNQVDSFFYRNTADKNHPRFSLKNKGSGLVSVIANQVYYPGDPFYDYTSESTNFTAPTNGSWFYLTLLINCSTGSIAIYVGSNLVATIATAANLFKTSISSYEFNGKKRDFIMRKWTAGNTVFTPTRLLSLS